MENNKIHGFKVFNPDWTCCPKSGPRKQYTCPGKFEEEGKLNICGHGMHFCVNAADCFNYYSFNSDNKVAEVIAYGTVLQQGDKFCTDKLEVVREIPWEEVLQLINIGKGCKGMKNTGDENPGNRNTGDENPGNWNAGSKNTGNWNTGNENTGNWNTGGKNTGDWNAGYENTGNKNTGNKNTGDWNAGYKNTGDGNTGNKNTGDKNTGDWNAGYGNTGDWNTGDKNTGDWNKSNFNTGCFMTEEQKIMMFNKPTDWTYFDWLWSDARRLLNQMPKNVVKWVNAGDMTEEEKAEYPTYKTTGGYLKELNESKGVQKWWNNLSSSEKDIILSLPNFDEDIFFQITGIRI